MATQVRIDVPKLEADAAERGWMRTDLARAAGVSDPTVSRAFAAGSATPRTVRKLAVALGKSIRRYLVRDAA